MHELTVQVIELVADLQHSADEEDKVSSSSARKRLLGTLLKPAFKASCAFGHFDWNPNIMVIVIS